MFIAIRWRGPLMAFASRSFALAFACLAVLLLFAFNARAQTATAPVQVIDFNGIIIAVVGGFFSLIAAIGTLWVQQHIKDKQAADTLGNAIRNSVGAIQQAAVIGVGQLNTKVALPTGTPDELKIGLQYALDHAGDEAKRLGITQDLIIDKVKAQIGLAHIDAATAAAAAPALPPLSQKAS